MSAKKTTKLMAGGVEKFNTDDFKQECFISFHGAFGRKFDKLAFK